MAERAKKINFKGVGRANKSTRSATGNDKTGETRGRHPPGLRGKEIGLWYARNSRRKKQLLPKPVQRNVVGMTREMEWKLESVLKNIKCDSFSNPQDDSTPSTSKSSATSLKTVSNETFPASTSTFETRYYQHIAEVKEISESSDSCSSRTLNNELIQDETLDKFFLEELKKKKENKSYRVMQEFRQRLPSYNSQEEIINTIESNQVVVISGETGCGKTTQVPQFILDHYILNGKGSLCSLVCSQPRRISAITVAERVAQERAEICGEKSVGYQIRLEKKIPRNQGSILFCTTGIVIKWLESDVLLNRASHIVIDEVHERDLLTDFLLIIVRRTLVKRPDLRVILMSASLNAERFSKYFGNCPILNIPGFTYPVTEYYLEDVLEMLNYRKLPDFPKKKVNWKNKAADAEARRMMNTFLRNLPSGKYQRNVLDYLHSFDESQVDLNVIVYLLQYLCTRKEEGAILVFLPGWDSISKLNSLIMTLSYFRSNSSKHLIIPLHSLMPTINQRDVFNRPPPGVRKIILATNIAETSITIDDIVYVIDCGKIKLKRFDVERNVATLQPEWVSLANAQQRRGRAGRVQAGYCFHLFTSLRRDMLEQYQLPEMLRTRLEELCLQIKLLKLGQIIPFLEEAMDQPSIEAVKLSLKFLQDLNALDSEENLTPLGFHLSHLPVDPQTGKMILFGAIFSCIDPITTIAASLSFKDAFVIPLGKEAEANEQRRRLAQGTKSDHLMLVNAFRYWESSKQERNEKNFCWDHFLSINTLRMLANMKKQFLIYLKDLHLVNTVDVKSKALNINSSNEKLLRAIICAGLYPNVACVKVTQRKMGPSRRNDAVAVATKHEKTAFLHPKSVNSENSERCFESPWLVYHQRMKSTDVYIHDSSMISPYPLLLFGGKLNCGMIGKKYGVMIDDWIKFWCLPERAKLILKLRTELDKLLENKIRLPGPTNWDVNSKEGALLNAIIDLISDEEISMMAGDQLNDETLEKCVIDSDHSSDDDGFIMGDEVFKIIDDIGSDDNDDDDDDD